MAPRWPLEAHFELFWAQVERTLIGSAACPAGLYKLSESRRGEDFFLTHPLISLMACQIAASARWCRTRSNPGMRTTPSSMRCMPILPDGRAVWCTCRVRGGCTTARPRKFTTTARGSGNWVDVCGRHLPTCRHASDVRPTMLDTERGCGTNRWSTVGRNGASGEVGNVVDASG